MDLGPHADQALSFFGLSTLAAACRTILSPTKRSFLGFLAGFTLAIFSGLIVGLCVWDIQAIALWQKWACIAVAGYIAPDFLLGLMLAGKKLSEDPLTVLKLIFRR